MFALSVRAPFAALLIYPYDEQRKLYETRGQWTGQRGLIAIHCSQSYLKREQEYAKLVLAPHVPWLDDHIDQTPYLGCVIGLAKITDCFPTNRLTLTPYQRLLGDYSAGRYAWKMEVVEAFAEPIPAKGRLGFWHWKPPPAVEWRHRNGY